MPPVPLRAGALSGIHLWTNEVARFQRLQTFTSSVSVGSLLYGSFCSHHH